MHVEELDIVKVKVVSMFLQHVCVYAQIQGTACLSELTLWNYLLLITFFAHDIFTTKVS